MNLENCTDKEKYLICRYLHKYAMSPMTDKEFDELEEKLKDSSFDQTDYFSDNVFDVSYDDDSKPIELLNKVLSDDEKHTLEIMENSGKSITNIDAYVSKSMKSYRTLRECYDWINQFKGVEFCISPKIDGINTTSLYDSNGIFQHSRTRGRSRSAIDISNKIINVIPQNINPVGNKDFVVAGEAVVSTKDLETYNGMVNKPDGVFVTCRGVALSILRRTDIPKECNDFVKIFVFRSNWGNTLSEGLDKAQSLGFNVVPHETYTFNYNTYEEYEQELTSLIWKYRTLMDNMNIPTDGIVLQINDNSYFSGTVTNTAYDGGNLAVKAVAWEPGIYTARVKDIIMDCEGNVQYNCKVQIEPTYTDEGKCMQFVNLYNINTLISNDIHEGDLIRFEYVNETTINFKEKIK